MSEEDVTDSDDPDYQPDKNHESDTESDTE